MTFLNTPPASRRCALYARVSTSDQRPDLQLDDLRRVAAQRGWKVVSEYTDLAVSGCRDRRPELGRLMADAHSGKLDMVVVWRFDRFARSVRHLVMALDDFRAMGVDFLSLNDGIDTSTPAGRFSFTIIAAVAELERELIRERTRAGLAAAKRRGARLGRPRAKLDADAMLALQASGYTLREIAAELHIGVSTLQRALRRLDPKTSSDGASQEACFQGP